MKVEITTTNFDFLKADSSFASFADAAISAEKILHIDPSACIINCRRAMEFAVKWMYSVDADLTLPYPDNLRNLMYNEDFRDIVDKDIWRRMELIRKNGNDTAHTAKKATDALARLCLEILFVFRNQYLKIAFAKFSHYLTANAAGREFILRSLSRIAARNGYCLEISFAVIYRLEYGNSLCAN